MLSCAHEPLPWKLNACYYGVLFGINNERSDNAAAKNEAFCIRYFLQIKNEPGCQKKYKRLIFLIMLGHMQKISHFWAQMKKDPKCQLGRFCPEPFNCTALDTSELSNYMGCTIILLHTKYQIPPPQ